MSRSVALAACLCLCLCFQADVFVAGLSEHKLPYAENASPNAGLIHTDGIAAISPGMGRGTATVQNTLVPDPSNRLYDSSDPVLRGNSPTKNFVTVNSNFEEVKLKHLSALIKAENDGEAEQQGNLKTLQKQTKKQHCAECAKEEAAAQPRSYPNAEKLRADIDGTPAKDNFGLNIKPAA